MGGKEPTNLKNSSLLPEEGRGGRYQAKAISHSWDKGHALFHPMFSLASDELPVKRGCTLESVNLIWLLLIFQSNTYKPVP
jgi:hypothetical protein